MLCAAMWSRIARAQDNRDLCPFARLMRSLYMWCSFVKRLEEECLCEMVYNAEQAYTQIH